MSKPLVLTCDIGTQSARALLVDPDGRIVDVVQSKYAEPYFSKEPGWAEQKPNFYFDRLCECCRELCARSNALLPDVIAMTITVIRDTVVCLDANNEPLRDIILWLDKRTVDPNGAMPAKNMMLFKVAGMEPTAKVVYAASVGNWIMRHEPEIWARTAKYVMLPTYLNYKLTGNLIDSASNQIGHIPFDYKNRRWMKPGSLTRCFCDVPNEKLCDLVPSGTVIGTVTDEVCALTGIPAGLPLISTGSDKGCETLGLGLFGRAALCLPFGLRWPGGDDDAHGHQIASRGEVLRREARLGEPAAEDHLGLHAVGSGLGHGEVLGRRGLRGAAALDLDGHRAVEDGGTVFGDAGDQAGELFAVSVPRDVEHVVVGDESEGVFGRRGSGGSVCRLAEGRDCQESQRKQKGQESIHGIMDLFGLPRGQNISGPDRGDSG